MQVDIIWIDIAIMMRPHSDLGRLQYQDVDFTWSDGGQLLGVSLVSRRLKENQWKTETIGIASWVDDTDCTLRTLKDFMDRIANIRVNLSKEHTLFLAGMKKENHIKSIKSATVTSWIQQVMQDANIDTSALTESNNKRFG
ncbi:hypothetical protein RO3G_05610 [Rhizopus delemar RA 99-880]|uniref:Uncharacterized protein n=1 Tax=Rhizopus delemar (strain RA 99-880 / ATCC MYA-4621 / FGSC 9543 / NRRL 43880) TaxID=246409 RepID=I1BXH5_RHIO9|nr:hypothetical protein RO3G_05610 [Rhizopus delemar RA 99-880]|eukprot:EIE80905.1 hypothetical protein RO3G_05610 [Rhizopus delemar RA 99-880]